MMSRFYALAHYTEIKLESPPNRVAGTYDHQDDNSTLVPTRLPFLQVLLADLSCLSWHARERVRTRPCPWHSFSMVPKGLILNRNSRDLELNLCDAFRFCLFGNTTEIQKKKVNEWLTWLTTSKNSATDVWGDKPQNLHWVVPPHADLGVRDARTFHIHGHTGTYGTRHLQLTRCLKREMGLRWRSGIRLCPSQWEEALQDGKRDLMNGTCYASNWCW